MNNRFFNSKGFAHVLVLVLVVLVVVLAGVGWQVYSHAAPPVGTSGTLIKSNCSPQVAASDGTMVWNSASNGIYDAYIGDASCNGSRLLPAAYAGNRGAADMTKDGRYVLLVTAVGWDKTAGWSQPGKGSNNAIQLFDRRSGRLSTLLPGFTASQRGVIWPMFNSDGTKIVWAQMLKSNLESFPWGQWELNTADLNLAAGKLGNIRSWQQPSSGNNLYEPYGWIPNTNKIIFMTTAGQKQKSTSAMQLYTLPDSLTGSATRISPPKAPAWWWQKQQDVYHEFVHFAPTNPYIFYTSIGTGGLGADLWKYDLRTADSHGLLAQPTRVTYFGGNFNAPLGQQNVANFPTAAYRLVGSLAWEDGGWEASVCSSNSCNTLTAYRITL